MGLAIIGGRLLADGFRFSVCTAPRKSIVAAHGSTKRFGTAKKTSTIDSKCGCEAVEIASREFRGQGCVVAAKRETCGEKHAPTRPLKSSLVTNQHAAHPQDSRRKLSTSALEAAAAYFASQWALVACQTGYCFHFFARRNPRKAMKTRIVQPRGLELRKK